MGNPEAIDFLIEKLETFDAKLEDFGELLMDTPEVDELISKLNVEQLNEGIKADGRSILPYYTRQTIAIKQKKGQETNFVTLRDTGDFQGGIRARSYKDKIEILSEDSKSADLQGRYGEEIFGLVDTNLVVVRDFLKPKFIYFARKVLL